MNTISENKLKALFSEIEATSRKKQIVKQFKHLPVSRVKIKYREFKHLPVSKIKMEYRDDE